MFRRREARDGDTRAASPISSAIPRPSFSGSSRPAAHQLALLVDPGAGERDHLGVLRRGQRRPQLLEHRDPVHPRRRADGRGVEWGVGEFPEAGEDRGQLGGDRVTRPDLGVRTHVRKIARPPLRARGAIVRLVPPEQSADLRKYYNKHTKTDRLDAVLLARIPLLHPEGLVATPGLGPAESLRRTVGRRASLVTRRAASGHRLEALLELLGPAWTAVLGTDPGKVKAACSVLERYADPHALLRLGRARLARLLIRTSRGQWREDKADALLAAPARPSSSGPTGPSTSPSSPRTSPPRPAGCADWPARSTNSTTASQPATSTPTPPGSSPQHSAWDRSGRRHPGPPRRPRPVPRPRRRPRLHRPRPQDRPVRHHRDPPGPNQGWRPRPALRAVLRRRPRPQDRPHPRPALPAPA